jgi:Family of unknown function (DUF5906)
MQLTFLEARVPLTKKFTASTKEPYPNAFEFKSHRYSVRNLAHFADLVEDHAKHGHCLLKGMVDRDLNWESRAHRTNPHALMLWACLDIDGIKSVPDIDTFMHRMGMSDVSYVLQWSASYGVYGSYDLRAHVFIQFLTPVAPTAAKMWLKQVNLQAFQSDLQLTKTQVSLRWGLDITTCQNDKLIFIAPPSCNPPSLDQFTGDRIQLVTKSKEKFDFSTVALLSAEQLKTLEEQEINRLRRAANLPERKARQFKLKEYKGEEYLPNPDQATVTGVKEERGFVYLNLNNGDSWGYYHPSDNPTFVYNFKGEPTYKTSELVPDYWDSVQTAKRAASKAQQGSRLFLAFRDLRTATYMNGWYDQGTQELTLHAAKSERQLEDFLANYGQPVPDSIPIWDIVYDPKLAPINIPKRQVNTFKPSAFMTFAEEHKTSIPAKPTPVIDKLITHVVGSSMYTHFFNWLAYCFQHKTAPKTAWVLHGTQGTGKGILLHRVLVPLFGQVNVCQRRMEELEDKFNDFIEGSLLVFVDEAQISDSGRNKMIMANIKNYITEPTVTVRRMRQSSYEINNHAGWIFASNMPDPVVVDGSDRRFNVGEYQADRLLITDTELQDLESELASFSLALASHAIDLDAVRTPVTNDAKKEMIMVSRSSADTVADAIVNGDLSVLWDALPTVPESMMDMQAALKLGPYRSLIYDLVVNKRDRITREELFIIFNYNVGNVSNSPWKMTTYFKHHGIAVKDIRMGDRVTKGVLVNWKNDDIWFAAKRAEIAAESAGKIHALPSTKRAENG